MYILNQTAKDYIMTDRLIIRDISASYIAEILDFHIRNRKRFEQFDRTHEPGFYTMEFHRRYIDYQLSESMKVHSFRYFTFLKEDPEHIVGTVSLSNINLGDSKSATLGYKTDESKEHLGLTQEAIHAVIANNCGENSLHHLDAYIMPSNKRSIKTIENCGFTMHSVAKDFLYRQGSYHDMLKYVYDHKPDWQM